MINQAYKTVDIPSWNRREQYYFFKDYDDPCFCLTANVDVTALLEYCKQYNQSFFLHSLYMVAIAVNEIPELRMRIRKDQQVIIYDQINIGCTVLKDDHTFLFAYMDYSLQVKNFIRHAAQSIHKTKRLKKLESKEHLLNVIHCSVLPWIRFTSIKHPRNTTHNSSIPKITIGQYFKEHNRYVIPISLQAHHALVDGYHAGQFYTSLNQYRIE